jgi:ADP-ribose pyrophosphatase YjhB (NUDIX family)
MWGMPGGKNDANPPESNVMAAMRELLEETGMSVTSLQLEPLHVGTSAGDNDFWVTTYLYTGPTDRLVLEAEQGLAISWLSEEEMCFEGVSPFAVYNKRVFAALKEYRG